MNVLTNLLKPLFGAAAPEQPAGERLANWDAWLGPLPGSDGVGRDLAYEDAFFAVKDEVAKLSGIDDTLITHACEQLLKEVGKDLRVAGYYAFARLRQDGSAGFAEGLELTAALVDRFGEAVLPARAEAKKGALEWLAATRMLDALAQRGDFVPADRERAIGALNLLIARTAEWSAPARPNLQPLLLRFASDEPPLSSSEAPSVTPPPVAGSTSTGASSGSGISSTRELLEQARLMAQYLRDQEYGYLPSARLIRCVRWDTVHEVPPADAQQRTRLNPPRAELRQQLKRLVLQKQWHELLERIEGAFAEGVNHLWFDLAYFQHVALEHIGAPYSQWRDLCRTDFSLLLERLPGIERLAYSDGTPFADDTTLEWIARHAVAWDMETGEALAPLPIAGDDGASGGDWAAIETQARGLLDTHGLEAAFSWLSSLPGPASERRRFLQRWLMARLAEQAGQPDVALHLLTELDATVRRFGLGGWEPNLTFEVKHCLLRVLKAALKRKDADKSGLTQRVDQLYGELTVLDPARMLALA